MAERANDVTRREEILRIAAGTFAQRGFRGSTIREIADRAKMLSGSLYYHFPSKEAMALEVVHSYFDELFAAYKEVLESISDPREQLRTLFLASLQVSDRRRDEVLILYQDWHSLNAVDNTLSTAMGEVEEIWVRVLERGVEEGQFRADMSPRLVYRAIMCAVSWVPRWYQSSGEYSIEMIGGAYADLVIDGLRGGR
jgi:AcrR family transcriptional regulator